MTGIIFSAAIVGGTGLIIGILLGVAGAKFRVDVDEKEIAVRECLPGNNCGGCGFPGCDGLAASIAKGEANVNACPVGGALVAEKIAGIMGVEAGETLRKVAFVKCAGDCTRSTEDYQYIGEKDCKLMRFVPGSGAKSCSFGCMGYGSCVKVCSEDAIRIVDGIAVVDKDRCIGCGMCVKECPNHVIELIPYDSRVQVKCNSYGKGKEVMKACETGCIGCKKCERTCKFEAITVNDNLAHIDYEKCKNCGMCAKECPRGIIVVTKKDNTRKVEVKDV